MTENSSANVCRKQEPFDIIDCVRFCRQKWWSIFIAAVACALLTLAVSALTPPRYEATAKLYILPADERGTQPAYLQVGSMLLEDYREVLKTQEVYQMVCREVPTELSYQQLQELLTVQSPDDTRLLYITVKHENAVYACRLANACAQAARSFIQESLHGLTPSVFSSALIPARATGFDSTLWTVFGFAAGATAALAYWIVFFCLDDRVRNAKSIKTITGLSVLADETDSASLLAARLINRNVRCILFTQEHSAAGGICSQLMEATARMHRKTLLIQLSESSEPSAEWLKCLKDNNAFESLVYPAAVQNAWMMSIPAGTGKTASVLFHPGMPGMIKQLQQQYDLMLIETPSLIQSADASAFLPLCDGVVLTAIHEQSRFRDLNAQIELLNEAGCAALGVVLLPPAVGTGAFSSVSEGISL